MTGISEFGARCAARFLVAVMAAAMGGCFFFGSDEDACASAEEYQASESRPGLVVPGGLDRPDESGRLEIPPGPAPAEPLDKTAACLQRPPDYFDKPIYTPKD